VKTDTTLDDTSHTLGENPALRSAGFFATW